MPGWNGSQLLGRFILPDGTPAANRGFSYDIRITRR